MAGPRFLPVSRIMKSFDYLSLFNVSLCDRVRLVKGNLMLLVLQEIASFKRIWKFVRLSSVTFEAGGGFQPFSLTHICGIYL